MHKMAMQRLITRSDGLLDKYYLQQSFFLIKIALNIFQKKLNMLLMTVINFSRYYSSMISILCEDNLLIQLLFLLCYD